MSDDLQQGITRALEQNGKLLAELLLKINELKKLKGIIDSYLEAKLSAKCHLANFENGHLAIITESAIWATQFRFHIPNLQTKLLTHPEFKTLREITCKVRPAISKESKAKQISPVELLTPETAKIIEDAAKNISHPKLKEVMKNISKHVKA